jgi:hypothetical protein
MVINTIYGAYKPSERRPDAETSRHKNTHDQVAFASLIPLSPLSESDEEARRMLASLKLQAELGLGIVREDRRSGNRGALPRAVLNKQQAYNSDIEQLIDIQNSRVTDLVS